MATKKCPHCGKKISSNSSFCLFCTQTLESETTKELDECTKVEQNKTSRHKRTIVVVLVSVALTAVIGAIWLGCAFGWFAPLIGFFKSLGGQNAQPHDNQNNTTSSIQQTQSSQVDPTLDAFYRKHTGYWVDENSVGKRDIQQQGGIELQIHSAADNNIVFDLISYACHDSSKKAFLKNINAVPDVHNTIHFTFEDDGCGFSGEGHLRFRGDEIDAEVLVNRYKPLSEDAHSLSMNTVFKRQSLPEAEGIDVLSLVSLQEVYRVVGEPTGEPVFDDETKKTTYVFSNLQVVATNDGTVEEVTVHFDHTGENAVDYRYDRIDGSMSYDIVKKYFGEAKHDYTEKPLDEDVPYYNIRVLHYDRLLDTAETTFVFQAENDMLITIKYQK